PRGSWGAMRSSSSFFGQAEGGIRDFHAGVQTCALPILERSVPVAPMPSAIMAPQEASGPSPRNDTDTSRITTDATPNNELSSVRSEERRVGKECRARAAAAGSHDRGRGARVGGWDQAVQ